MCYHVSPEMRVCWDWFHSFPTDSRHSEAGRGTLLPGSNKSGLSRGSTTFTWKTQLPWYHGLWKSLNNSKIQSLIRYIFLVSDIRYWFFLGEKEQQWEDFTAPHVQTPHIGSKMLPSSGHFLGQHVSIILSCNLWQPAVIVVCIHYYKIL